MYWRFEIERANDQALALFARFTRQARDRQTPEQIRFVDLFDDPDEIIRTLDLPKWNYCEDFDSHSMSGGSAYDYPDEGFKRLMFELSKLDARIIAFFRYTDEAMQLAGAGCFVGPVLKLSERLEYDDIEAAAIDQYGDYELADSMETVVDKMQTDVSSRPVNWRQIRPRNVMMAIPLSSQSILCLCVKMRTRILKFLRTTKKALPHYKTPLFKLHNRSRAET